MSIMYNNLNVDEKYSSILEPNLYFGSVFVPGVTCTDKYQIGPAGAIYVHKLSTTACEVGKPGRDFTDEEAQDELIPILLNNNYLKSKKIRGVQAAAVAIPLANERLSTAIAEAREGWQLSAGACLVNEATVSADTREATKENIKSVILAVRKEIVKKKGRANVVMCSPDFYTTILEAAGAEFTPSRNDKINASGNVGQWLGFIFVENNGLSATNAKYYDHTGTLKTVSLANVDFIMYYSEALSAVTNFETARIVDTDEFVGSKAQTEMNAGFRVTNKDLAYVHKHTTTPAQTQTPSQNG